MTKLKESIRRELRDANETVKKMDKGYGITMREKGRLYKFAKRKGSERLKI